jgi:hypothetical protein
MRSAPARRPTFRLSFEWPVTNNFSLWYASSTIFGLSVIAGLAVYGCYTSLGGQKVFAGKLLED